MNNSPMQKVNDVQLPFFYGFYNSPLDLSEYALEDELSCYQGECKKDVTIDDLDFDWKEYQKAIVDCFVDTIKGFLPSWINAVENPELDSPKFYNFRNDEIFATVELSDDWKNQIEKFVEANHDWLKEHIKKDWSSRSGFMSFIEDDFEAFMEKVYEAEPRYISIMMQYFIEVEQESDTDDMYELITDLTIETFHFNDNERCYVFLNNEEENEPNENGYETEATTETTINNGI